MPRPPPFIRERDIRDKNERRPFLFVFRRVPERVARQEHDVGWLVLDK
jgi:hypothetical protein